MCLEYAEDHFVVSTKPTSGQPSAGPSTQYDPSLPSVQEQMDIDAPNNPGPSTSTIQPEPSSAHAPAQMESSISSNNTMNPGPSLIHPAPVLSPAPAQMESSTSTDYLVVQMTDITRQIKELTWQTLNEDIRSGLVSLRGALGELIKDDVSKDGRENILLKYKDLSYVSSVDPVQWIEQRNAVLRSFLCGATGCNPPKDSQRKVGGMVNLLEQIHHLRDLNLITPFSFRQNLVIYSSTNSKIASQIFGSSRGAGSYTTVTKVITTPSDPLECPSMRDIHTAIDNNQKVGHHSGRIREGSSVPMSICTSVSHISPPIKSMLQYSDTLKPSVWLNQTPLNECLKLVEELEEKMINIFREILQ